ncbi:hypothetical protein [Gloeobacter morelensis]|uniref:Uncharacterized protein n=1 Tax=Gloeobacter morelensis MG652769 TaxID=2781736 RepID=A0ABY3PS97_9CYAN|nr:hypothetical protein [Gloeobacter morelensis]UFP96309.1 hypothetical protein ISF26_08910 [Gloeobacter morelensis MG652769]
MSTQTPALPTAQQIQTWNCEATRRYRDFELVLQFRHDRRGWQYSLHLEALPQASEWNLVPLVPQRTVWYPLELLWRPDGKSEPETFFDRYPEQVNLLVCPIDGSAPAAGAQGSPLKMLWHFLMLASG